VAHFLCAKLAVECLERKQDAEFPVRPATILPQSRGLDYQAGYDGALSDRKTTEVRQPSQMV
jgi:hypothetical protein